MSFGFGFAIGSKFIGGAPSAPSAPNPNFISTWDTTNTGSASDTVVLPLLSGGTYSGTIDWGDGNTSALSYANRTHVYSSSGTYTITISGQIEGFQFANSGDKAKITDISNWGTLNITTDRAFDFCTNLDISATDAPLISTTTFYSMFRGCSSLTTPDFSEWNTSNITDFREIFNSATNFNGDIESWDVGAVTVFTGAFRSASNFNRDISTWDVSNATNLTSMFRDSSFNQDISSWDVSNVQYFGFGTIGGMFDGSSFNQDIGGWTTTSLIGMGGMFRGTSFNQDISGWDVSNVTNFKNVFQNNSVFNQPIGSWDTSSATLMNDMFYNTDAFDQDISSWDVNQVTHLNNFMILANGLSTANYDALLIAWDAQGAMAFSGTVNFGSSKYTSGGAAESARTSLISKWGGITDGGAV